MTVVSPGRPVSGNGPEPEALIREARRRHRRRLLVVAVIAGMILAGVVAVIASLGPGGGPQPSRGIAKSAASTSAVRSGPSGMSLARSATALLMWPVGYPVFTASSGPTAYLADLDSGRIASRQIPQIAAGDFQPYLIGVGGQFVYAGAQGTMSIPADLKGAPRVLGATPFFAPSAAADRVWLVRYGKGGAGQGPATVQQVLVTGSRPGPAVTLPAAADFVVRGTDAGFLLQLTHRHGLGVVLWTPGNTPRNLPHWIADAPTAGIGEGFDATSRLVAYGTGCRSRITAKDAPHANNTGYITCAMLRVLDVLTSTLRSFPAPPGTAGWVPRGFDSTAAISPAGNMIAAYAATQPLGDGRVRLYVMRLSGSRLVAAVPSSAALFYDQTAWTANGAWLLYQGAGGHLSAYRIASGTVQESSTPCCAYTAFASARRAH